MEKHNKETETKKCTIPSAFELVLPIANKYEPKKDSNWFEYLDEDGVSRFFECEQGTYCEDCSEEKKKEILKDKEITFPEDFYELIISTETSKENEGFLNCDSCNEIIECAIIWEEEELEYWIALDDEYWKGCKDNVYSYYQVSKVLEETYGAVEEFNDKCLIIAKNVLKHWL